jgi:hypothetical protein
MSTLARDTAVPTAFRTTGKSFFSTLVVTTVTTGAGVADGNGVCPVGELAVLGAVADLLSAFVAGAELGAGVIADFSASSADFLEHPNKLSVMINPPMAIKAKGLGLEVWIEV